MSGRLRAQHIIGRCLNDDARPIRLCARLQSVPDLEVQAVRIFAAPFAVGLAAGELGQRRTERLATAQLRQTAPHRPVDQALSIVQPSRIALDLATQFRPFRGAHAVNQAF